FKFIPYVYVDSRLRVEFTHGLRFWLNSQRSKVEQTVNSKLRSEVPRMLKEAVGRHVNPRLQKLKQKLISKNYTHFGIDWKAQGGFLRVAIKLCFYFLSELSQHSPVLDAGAMKAMRVQFMKKVAILC
ncbi:hypothetical protein ANCCAN_19877, partial [Ancylostoma caninum]